MSSENWQERIERQMAFILEQQAHYEVRSAKIDERWSRTEEGIRALLTIAEIHEREIIQLAEARRVTDESLKELREALKEQREAGRATDERLDNLINVVERQISDRNNRKS